MRAGSCAALRRRAGFQDPPSRRSLKPAGRRNSKERLPDFACRARPRPPKLQNQPSLSGESLPNSKKIFHSPEAAFHEPRKRRAPSPGTLLLPGNRRSLNRRTASRESNGKGAAGTNEGVEASHFGNSCAPKNRPPPRPARGGVPAHRKRHSKTAKPDAHGPRPNRLGTPKKFL